MTSLKNEIMSNIDMLCIIPRRPHVRIATWVFSPSSGTAQHFTTALSTQWNGIHQALFSLERCTKNCSIKRQLTTVKPFAFVETTARTHLQADGFHRWGALCQQRLDDAKRGGVAGHQVRPLHPPPRRLQPIHASRRRRGHQQTNLADRAPRQRLESRRAHINRGVRCGEQGKLRSKSGPNTWPSESAIWCVR